MGPNYILVTISVDFQDDIDADTVEQTTADISHRVKQVYPQVKRIFIEAGKRNQMAMRKNIQTLKESR